MKKRTASFLAILVTGVLILVSCTRSPDSIGANNGTNSASNITAGNWRVTLFSERGINETADFAGFSFSFNANGVLVATRNGVSQNGTWSITNSSTKFNIDLGPKTDVNKPLGELTDNWKIISVTATEIKLTDDNATSAEFLTFTKI